jgi:cytochrome P450
MTAALYDPTATRFSGDYSDVYRRMRDTQPVYRDPAGRFYALTRFADVFAALQDWPTFSSEGRIEANYAKPSMHMMDPPRQQQLRVIVRQAFTPRRIADLEGRIREIADELIDGFAGDRRCDAAQQYAVVLPSRVTAELIGIPDDLVPYCRELTDINLRRRRPEDVLRASQGSDEVFTELLRLRRADPQDDLLSALIVADVAGERLTDDELLGFCWLLLVGGNDTTTNLIANGLARLGEYPEQRAELVGDSSRLGGALEEMIRLDTPAQMQPRTATRDVELEGGVIPARSRVLLVLGAANLDEREFAEPDRFDIHRNATRHLGFGYGVHFCLGAALARLEARVAFEQFLARIPDYAVAAGAERIVSMTFRGYEKLPLTF